MRYAVAIAVVLWSGVVWGGKLYIYEAVPYPQQPEDIYAAWFDYPVLYIAPSGDFVWNPGYAVLNVPELGISTTMHFEAPYYWYSPDRQYYTENMRFSTGDYSVVERLPDGTRIYQLVSDPAMREVFNNYQQKLFTPTTTYRFGWTEHVGDVNLDRTTDALDASIMFESWGRNEFRNMQGHSTDQNGDGVVDAADAGIVFEGWTGDVAPVPEPSGIWLLGICAYNLRRAIAEFHL